jgi:hypothetical protein
MGEMNSAFKSISEGILARTCSGSHGCTRLTELADGGDDQKVTSWNQRRRAIVDRWAETRFPDWHL